MTEHSTENTSECAPSAGGDLGQGVHDAAPVQPAPDSKPHPTPDPDPQPVPEPAPRPNPTPDAPPESTPGAAPAAKLDRRRYLRVVLFLIRVLAHVVAWDVLLRRVAPGTVRRSSERRWRGLAGRYRALAVAHGGLLIKFGQFMSIRVDVLPKAVTSELSGLQDEVPPETFQAVSDVIEASFGQVLSSVFARVDADPLGSASLAQVHRAELPTGEHVVVKVQRPGIRTMVETDLASFRFGVRMLKRFGWLKRRADLDKLYDEFARTTRAELDFVAEGHNAEAFDRNFAADHNVLAPSVYWAYTRTRVLTLEEMSGIKISDLDALDVAGIESVDVAKRLVDAYFQQMFEHNFIHSDPHPGNLFVSPLPRASGMRDDEPTGFRLVFVDFGMMAVVPERVRAHLRDYLIGFATRDPSRIVRAYEGAGVLLPGADLRRIEEVHAALFDRFWGVRIGDLQELAFSEMGTLIGEFNDLIRDMPFQLPADLLFVGRSMGMLSGLATQLDPEFDVWSAMEPYARRLAVGETPRKTGKRRRPALPLEEQMRTIEAQVRTLLGASSLLEVPARSLLSLPGGLDRVVQQAATGQLMVRVDLGDDLRKDVDRLAGLVRSLTWAIACAAVVMAGAIIRQAEGPSVLADVMLGGAALALLFLLFRR